MKYLVLHNFRSYGKYLRKGEVVDEAEIRSPRLRQSEGKIVPAVSSMTAPESQGVAAPETQAAVTSNGDQNTEASAAADTPETQATKEAPKPPEVAASHPRLSFGHH